MSKISKQEHLTDDQMKEIVELAHDFQMVTGRIKKDDDDDENGSNYSLMSFLLFPLPIKEKHFQQAIQLQTKYQVRTLTIADIFRQICQFVIFVKSSFFMEFLSITLACLNALKNQSNKIP